MRVVGVPLLSMVATLAACGGSSSTEGARPVELSGEPVELAYVIPSGHPSGVEPFTDYREPVRLVVRDEAAWADAWVSLVGSGRDAPPRPAIDFEEEVVVIAALGVTGGDRTLRMPLAALRPDGSLAVAVEAAAHGASCAWAPVETRQAAAARVRRADVVGFVEFSTVRECE